MTKRFTTIFLISLFFSAPLLSQNQSEKVKSLFIYNFTRYIKWPRTSGTFTIGVLGNDQSILNAFKDMASKKSSTSLKFIVSKFSDPAEAARYDLVYIPEKNSRLVGKVAGLKKTLLVTEKAGMTKSGSNINFIQKEGKIRFEMNKASIEKSELKVSSQLVELAIVV